ncbi:TonB-dependent receptor [Stakelama sp. CBK3Z-3]|uniref:TonB-dependent receptor n=1 Tax=Stakelama flava TaxID=2860338 RepID=A0ABS6XPA7_9SPHN|nr:TonB-dependent receptor [Stakelama flava]MBW4331246.1 TonB-dependent receptor [Stakelama flava]
MLNKAMILCSASLFAVAIAGPARAQDTNQDNQAPARQNDRTSDDSQNDTSTQPAAQAPVAQDIVVTGVRASLSKSVEIKRDSTQIVDSVVATDIGKLPDNNVVEALQRLSGVQVTDRGGGETSTLSIRGLTDPLTTWNGRDVFTGSGRSFSLQDIPASLLSRVDVYKTRAADQIPTGLAGQIDVITRRPLDFDGLAVSAVARGIYDESAETFNPNLNATISDHWETGIGDIGVMVSGSYSRTKYRDMSVTAGALVPFATENPPEGSPYTPLERIFPGSDTWQAGTKAGLPYEPGSTLDINGVETPYYLSRDAVFSSDLHGKRERPSVNAALQWAPDENQTYTAEFMWTGFRQSTFNNLMFSYVDWWGDLGDDPGSTFTLYDGTNIIKSRTVGSVYGFNSSDYTKSKTDTFVYALNGQWKVNDGGTITADLSYQDSKYSTDFFAMRTFRTADSITADFNAGGGVASYHFGDDSLLTDPNQWTIGELYDNSNTNSGKAYTLKVDGVQEVDGGFFKSFQAGIRYDDRKASAATRSSDAGILGLPLTALGEEALYTNSDFFNGRADVPTSWVVPNGSWLYKNADTIRQLYLDTLDTTNGIAVSSDQQMINVFNIDEITMAAYFQANAQINIFGRPLKLQAGARYVDVDTDVRFTDQYTLETTSASATTAKMLPSFTARYDITPNLLIRFNYGQTLRRPAFADLNPNYTLTGDLTEVGYGTGSRGNPDLQPTESTNYDLSLEWYFAPDSMVYGTLFRRDVEGLVVTTTALETVNGTGLNTNVFNVSRPTNSSNGVLKGIEAGFVVFPDLPGLLNGLGAQGSLTVLDSSQNVPFDVDMNTGEVLSEVKTDFFGVSDFSYNITGVYQHGPLSLRLAYVWRSKFLYSNEAALFANPIGIWRKPESSLDFQLTYDITPHLGFTLDAVNLTKQTQQNYYKFEDAGGPEMFNLGTTIIPRTFAIGVRYRYD